MDIRAVRVRMGDAINPSPFASPASLDHRDMYADAVMELLLEGGVDQVTMASVARALGQTSSAVKQMAGSRRRFLAMVVGRFGGRWAGWAAQPAFRGGVRLRLPVEPDELHGVRTWSVLREIAAGEARAGVPELAEACHESARYERAMLVAALQGRSVEPTDEVVTALLCLADGLRAAMVDPVAPLGYEAAKKAADLVIERICGAEALAAEPVAPTWDRCEP